MAGPTREEPKAAEKKAAEEVASRVDKIVEDIWERRLTEGQKGKITDAIKGSNIHRAKEISKLDRR